MFDGDGLLRDTYWDDESFPLTRDKQGQSSKPDYDFTNLGLLFPNGDAEEIIYINSQMQHKKKFGTALSLHVHYIQSEETQPTFKVDYKFYNNGETVPADWTTLSTADGSKGIFTYTAGDLLQIAEFPDIPAPANENVSANLDMKFYRDDSDVTGDILTKYLDYHYQINSFGSEGEYDKTE